MSIERFANIVLEKNPRSLSFPSLYCRSDNSWVYDEDNECWSLYGKGTYDFTTYFNALSVAKLKQYTSVTRFFLHLELKGSPFVINQTYADSFSTTPQRLGEIVRSDVSMGEWKSYDIELSVPENTVLLSFVIKTEGRLFIKDSYYSVDTPNPLRDVELVLSTTTFKKEDYILGNIQLVKDEILSSDEPIADHFRMQVIDNGRTLNAESLSEERISISPNENVGGAGGFARGMVEALDRGEATHILLMDDDVAVSPESIKRTFNLLRMVNDEYKEAFVSGAMLNYDFGEEQWEDVGHMAEDGGFYPVKPQLHLTRFEDLVLNETFEIPSHIKSLKQCYAAWWYCCIPVTCIKKNGLPLPYFVRADDAEYGVRCQPLFMTMNSICIWHSAFHSRYNPAVERYQTTRNTLIARYTTGFAPHADFLERLKGNVQLELKKFNYADAELVLDALEDFLRGPEYFSSIGVAEKTFIAANKNKEKRVPLNELQEQVRNLGFADFDVSLISRQDIEFEGFGNRALLLRVEDCVTDNKQRLLVSEGEGYAVVPSIGWAYPANAIRDKRYIIAIDWRNRCGSIRKKDPKRYRAIQKRLSSDLHYLKKNEANLKEAYSSQRDRLTSLEFWKNYLGMN